MLVRFARCFHALLQLPQLALPSVHAGRRVQKVAAAISTGCLRVAISGSTCSSGRCRAILCPCRLLLLLRLLLLPRRHLLRRLLLRPLFCLQLGKLLLRCLELVLRAAAATQRLQARAGLGVRIHKHWVVLERGRLLPLTQDLGHNLALAGQLHGV
jgi:hypothetical protein